MRSASGTRAWTPHRRTPSAPSVPVLVMGIGTKNGVRRLTHGLVLLALVALLGLAAGCKPPDESQAQGNRLVTDSPTPTIAPTHTATATSSPTLTPSPTSTPTPTPTPAPPTATPTPTATPSRTPTLTPAPASDHLWLDSPIGPEAEGDRIPGVYFPYGSTGGGRYHLHHGVDYMNPLGTPVLAAADGVVIVAGNDLSTVYGAKLDFYGNLVIQELDQRFQEQPVYVLYGHLSELAVRAGDHMQTGDVVGLVGMTGVAIGHHLHLEVRLGSTDYGSTRNPVLWLQPEPGQGIIAGLLVDKDGLPVPETPVTFFRSAEPSKWWRQTHTYADLEVNPDDALGENFALNYVPAGEYLVKAKVGEKSYVRSVTVADGDVAFVVIEAEE